MQVLDLGFIVLTQDQILGLLLSAFAAVLGLLAHNIVKGLSNREIDIVISLPTIENGKLRIGGTLTNLILAFVVGMIFNNPPMAFLAGVAGAGTLREILQGFEQLQEEYRTLE